MSILIAEFHWMSYTHLLMMLNDSKHRPEGLCQLLAIIVGRFDTKLKRTFRSNVLSLSVYQKLCITQQV